MELDIPEEYLDIFEVLDDDAIELEFIFFGIPKQIYQRSDFFSSLDDIAFKRLMFSKKTSATSFFIFATSSNFFAKLPVGVTDGLRRLLHFSFSLESTSFKFFFDFKLLAVIDFDPQSTSTVSIFSASSVLVGLLVLITSGL